MKIDTNPEDDDEYARYLSQYIADNAQEIFLGVYNGKEVILNTKNLYNIIKKFNNERP